MQHTFNKLFKGLTLREIEEIVLGSAFPSKQRIVQPIYVKNRNDVTYKKKPIVV